MYLVEIMRGCPWNCRFSVFWEISSAPLGGDVLTSGRGKVAEKIRRSFSGRHFPIIPNIGKILCIEGVQFSITSLRASGAHA